MKSQLPLQPECMKVDDYVEALLSFVTSSDLLQKLCGGVHILDFLTREPDLYSTILPKEWRDWFQIVDVPDVLDLLMREDIKGLRGLYELNGSVLPDIQTRWRGLPIPPLTLLRYINDVRGHSLDRTFRLGGGTDSIVPALVRNVSVGMKPKKIHEVENFASYIDKLTKDIAHSSSHDITHIVDFGSGQNYLGRALASEPYNKHIVAVESKPLNINGAMGMDVTAKLAKNNRTMRNKKEYRREESVRRETGLEVIDSKNVVLQQDSSPHDRDTPVATDGTDSSAHTALATKGGGGIQYIEHIIEDGDLEVVCNQIESSSDPAYPGDRSTSNGTPQTNGVASEPLQLMVVSLHSCGNLLHHGLRSLILNPRVKAVAMVGCCYNLVTERLGPPTFKLPTLRPPHPRLDRTSSTCDPHGFPMSERLARYQHKHGEGIRLNITARMMAVQAPQNWTTTESEAFFTRHFYRALLQRVFLDRGIVETPTADADGGGSGSPRGWSGVGQPIVIGSLRKACYTSFIAYVRGAVAKIAMDQGRGSIIAEHMSGLTDDEIHAYEEKYQTKRKELSVVWSLMAFSAGVVESTIVVDRWLYLREQKEVKDCRVEVVFDYKQSPRNIVVVGIKH
ncbi:MAG: hypothetical protein LQ347_004947 [Umbilicaria vellea]|nr:MAG: hypothetical protein LQ347_004947 [Umbilicaria vellea]